MTKTVQTNDYSAGHPWYYKLDGKVLTPKQILADVMESGYQGYMQDDIKKLNKKAEPMRSAGIRKFTLQIKESLRSNISQYRKYARELAHVRKHPELLASQPICSDVHMSMSLKHNHIYNDFGHLVYLESIKSKQMDLFNF
ncbi:MAG: hypothetical protein COB24_12665 [Hyphomicrobiales bacterium]|nr:MAG: hypothetical protein COB24_12665 [Hyphomicrobiales bacterium]